MGAERSKKAIEALIDAKNALTNAGIQGFTTEDVRCMAISFLIEEERSKGRGGANSYTPPATTATTGGGLVCPKCGSPMKLAKNRQYYNCVKAKMVDVNGTWVNQGCFGYKKV